MVKSMKKSSKNFSRSKRTKKAKTKYLDGGMKMNGYSPPKVNSVKRQNIELKHAKQFYPNISNPNEALHLLKQELNSQELKRNAYKKKFSAAQKLQPQLTPENRKLLQKFLNAQNPHPYANE